MPEHAIEWRDLDDVQSAEVNPKAHADERIAASMRRFGFTEPPLLDGRTGRLVAGHGRLDVLRAMHAAGDPPPPGITVTTDGRWQLPVVVGWASADDAEAAAYLVASNRLVELGGWDDGQLTAALADLAAVSPDLAQLAGWDPAQLAEQVAALDVARVDPAEGLALIGQDLPAATEADPHPAPPADDLPPVPRTAVDAALDVAPPAPAEPVTRVGDVWQLGAHRVLCGDATSSEDVARLLAGDPGPPDAMLTDPPYCSGGFQEAGRSAGSIGTNAKIRPRIANDTLSTRGYTALMRRVIATARPAILYVFTDWRMWVNLFDVVEASGYGVRNMIVWDKGTPGMGVGWRAQHELVMFASRAALGFDLRKAQGNVVQAKRTGNPLHPTQKPVDLLTKILDVTDMAATIYDPFAGSGSILMACEAAGRVCRAAELDPRFVDVICRRWQERTGQAPTRDGEPHDFLADDWTPADVDPEPFDPAQLDGVPPPDEPELVAAAPAAV